MSNIQFISNRHGHGTQKSEVLFLVLTLGAGGPASLLKFNTLSCKSMARPTLSAQNQPEHGCECTSKTAKQCATKLSKLHPICAERKGLSTLLCNHVQTWQQKGDHILLASKWLAT